MTLSIRTYLSQQLFDDSSMQHTQENVRRGFSQNGSVYIMSPVTFLNLIPKTFLTIQVIIQFENYFRPNKERQRNSFRTQDQVKTLVIRDFMHVIIFTRLLPATRLLLKNFKITNTLTMSNLRKRQLKSFEALFDWKMNSYPNKYNSDAHYSRRHSHLLQERSCS